MRLYTYIIRIPPSSSLCGLAGNAAADAAYATPTTAPHALHALSAGSAPAAAWRQKRALRAGENRAGMARNTQLWDFEHTPTTTYWFVLTHT